MTNDDTQQPNDEFTDDQVGALFDQGKHELWHERRVAAQRIDALAAMRWLSWFYTENDMTDEDKAVFRNLHRDCAARGAHRCLRGSEESA